MGKGSQNEYVSRLGFNMFKLPDGEYTLVIEFFPPTMDRVTVNVVSSSLNIGQQSTKLFPKYTRSIVHMNKYDVTPPEYIYVDMRCQGTASTPAQGVGRLIVYGIEGKQNDVDSDVYDALYIVEKGKMVMQTDLDINGHQVFNSKYYIQGHLDTSKGNKFSLNGFEKIPIPAESIASEISFHLHPLRIPFPRFNFRISLDYGESVSKVYDVVTPNLYNTIPTKLFTKDIVAPCVIVTALSPVPKNREILMLITYIVP
jgi:hypothetical protein